MCICICLRIHLHMYVHIHIDLCVCVCVHTHMFVHLLYMYICTFTSVCVCVCACMHACVLTYVRIFATIPMHSVYLFVCTRISTHQRVRWVEQSVYTQCVHRVYAHIDAPNWVDHVHMCVGAPR